MSSLRSDPLQRPVPTGFSKRAARQHQIPQGGIDSLKELGVGRGMGSFLSVVVPAKNEASSLPQLIAEIVAALSPLCTGERRTLAGYEVIVVDDGSTDLTRSVLRALTGVFPELRAMVLAVSVGQSSATIAGIRTARGNWIATLDADLQNDPADLVRLWNALPGHDVVLGWRVNRQGHGFRRAISRWANRVRNMVLGQEIRDTGCSVRIFPRALALHLPMFHGMHRFFGPLFLREGCRVIQVPVHDRPRPHGQSHYNLWNRSFQVVLDLLGVTWLMRRPVRCQVVQMWGSRGAARGSRSGVRIPARAPLYQED
jgi:dolichol-phosphate mannosyltransferase